MQRSLDRPADVSGCRPLFYRRLFAAERQRRPPSSAAIRIGMSCPTELPPPLLMAQLPCTSNRPGVLVMVGVDVLAGRLVGVAVSVWVSNGVAVIVAVEVAVPDAVLVFLGVEVAVGGGLLLKKTDMDPSV